jgi:hypothetical protein
MHNSDANVLWCGSDISGNCNALGKQREGVCSHRTSRRAEVHDNLIIFYQIFGGHHPRYEVSGRPDSENNTNVPIHTAVILCGGSQDCKHMLISSPEVYDQILGCTEIIVMVPLRAEECAVLDHNTQLLLMPSLLNNSPVFGYGQELHEIKASNGHHLP